MFPVVSRVPGAVLARPALFPALTPHTKPLFLEAVGRVFIFFPT